MQKAGGRSEVGFPVAVQNEHENNQMINITSKITMLN